MQDALDFGEEGGELGGEEGEMEEGYFSKSPEELKAIGLKAIAAHPMKKKTYAQFMQQDPMKADKYAIFVGKNPDAKQITWDEAKQDFINKAVLSVASGEGLAGK